MFSFHPLIGYLHLEKHLPKSLSTFDQQFIFLLLLSQTLLSLYQLGVTSHFDKHLRGNFEMYTFRGSGPWSYDFMVPWSWWGPTSLMGECGRRYLLSLQWLGRGWEQEGKRKGEGTRSCWNKIWSPETRTLEWLEFSSSGISHNLLPTPSNCDSFTSTNQSPTIHSPRPDPTAEDQAFWGDTSYLKYDSV